MRAAKDTQGFQVEQTGIHHYLPDDPTWTCSECGGVGDYYHNRDGRLICSRCIEDEVDQAHTHTDAVREVLPRLWQTQQAMREAEERQAQLMAELMRQEEQLLALLSDEDKENANTPAWHDDGACYRLTAQDKAVRWDDLAGGGGKAVIPPIAEASPFYFHVQSLSPELNDERQGHRLNQVLQEKAAEGYELVDWQRTEMTGGGLYSHVTMRFRRISHG